jgi:putative Ca2+/H+ antiporter (TMEM165/GDT1 family)
MTLLAAWPLASFLTFHLGAIACAVATRIAAHTRFEALFHALFVVTLAAVGVSTWLGHADDRGSGIPSGITFIAMVLVAVIDFRRTSEPAHRHQFALYR